VALAILLNNYKKRRRKRKHNNGEGEISQQASAPLISHLSHDPLARSKPWKPETLHLTQSSE